MKQTVEEAAREYANENYVDYKRWSGSRRSCDTLYADIY